MNEIFDKLLIRIILCIIIFVALFSYRYLHFLFFKKIKGFSLRSIYPEKNLPHALYLGARMTGFIILVSGLGLDLSNGLLITITNLVYESFVSILLYFTSIYVLESIVLYNFTVEDEVIRRHNLSFSVVSSSLSVAAAIILSKVLGLAGDSTLDLLFLWLYSLVLFGISTKIFSLIFKINLNRSISQHHLPTSFNYSGFIFAWVIIISSILNQDLSSHRVYLTKSFIDLLLNIIIYPIFFLGINYIFYIRKIEQIKSIKEDKEFSEFGIFEGMTLLLAALLTVMITSSIQFGSFYPAL